MESRDLFECTRNPISNDVNNLGFNKKDKIVLLVFCFLNVRYFSREFVRHIENFIFFSKRCKAAWVYWRDHTDQSSGESAKINKIRIIFSSASAKRRVLVKNFLAHMESPCLSEETKRVQRQRSGVQTPHWLYVLHFIQETSNFLRKKWTFDPKFFRDTPSYISRKLKVCRALSETPISAFRACFWSADFFQYHRNRLISFSLTGQCDILGAPNIHVVF